MKSKLLHEVEGLKTFALAFSSGEQVKEQLLEFAREHEIKAAQLTAIGAFSEVTLAYFDWNTKQYQPIPIHQQVEVVAMNGNLSLNDGEPRLHAHVVVGRSDGTACAGHFMSATVRPTLEVLLVEAPSYLRRTLDQESGLPLLDLAA